MRCKDAVTLCGCAGNLFVVRCTNCEQIQPNTDSPICEALRDKGSALILPSSVAKNTQLVLCQSFSTFVFISFACNISVNAEPIFIKSSRKMANALQ